MVGSMTWKATGQGRLWTGERETESAECDGAKNVEVKNRNILYRFRDYKMGTRDRVLVLGILAVTGILPVRADSGADPEAGQDKAVQDIPPKDDE